ncbi:hypothetical protein RIF29_28609 [Crotalaria pallida]|uniref:Uncharacterized protein n=1 Tax=Crotalaria pallida TaxID=3830 RepID=A0AAN9HWN9_CROPI
MGKQKNGGRNKRRSDQRKKEKERQQKERILCLEIDGDLIGIDLNRDDTCESPRTAPKPCSSYYDSVYEFDADRIKNVMCNNHPSVLFPKDVLRSVTTLNEPKFSLVANLGGTTYILPHSKLLYTNSNIPLPYFESKDPKFTFERFDPFDKSWHQAPTPLFYEGEGEGEREGESESEGEGEGKSKGEGEGEGEGESKSESEMLEPQKEEPILVYEHLVVEDKLLLFCHDLVYVFSHLTQKWETSYELYTSIKESFKRCGQDVPNTGLWLCDFKLVANAGGDYPRPSGGVSAQSGEVEEDLVEDEDEEEVPVEPTVSARGGPAGS